MTEPTQKPAPAKRTAAKKAPARRSPRAAKLPAPTPEIPAGVLRLGQRPDPVETEPFFELDGIVYEIAKAPKPNQGLRFLRESQDPRIGFAAAQANLLRVMVGPDAVRALEESESVSKADITALFDALTEKLFGAEPADPS